MIMIIIMITITIITMMMIMNNNNNNNNDNNNNDDNHNNNDNSNNNDDASGCFFTNVTFTAVAEISIRGDLFFKSYHCPACRSTLIATRFWVVMICPIIKCLAVLRVFFYFVWFVFIHHNFQFYFELCTYCNILDIYLSQNLNFVNYLLFYMKLLNYLFFNMFGSVLECCELTGVSLLWPWLIKWK